MNGKVREVLANVICIGSQLFHLLRPQLPVSQEMGLARRLTASSRSLLRFL